MPITQNGQGQIIYTIPVKERQFEQTGTVNDNDFAIADSNNQLKQIQFEVNPLSPGAGIATLQVDIGSNSTINLSSIAGAYAFGIVQPDSGTSPTATASSDTLTIHSNTAALTVTGSSATKTISLAVATSNTSTTGLLSSTDWNTFNGKQASGSYITALSSDVTATGPGSVAATVNSVGGKTSSAIATSVNDTVAATSANTVSTIVKRDSSGNFTAGVVTGTIQHVAANAVAVAGNYSVGASDLFLFVTASSSWNITLPTPNYRELYIVDIAGTSITNPITLVPHASEKISGLAASRVLAGNFNSWHLVDNGTDWYLL